MSDGYSKRKVDVLSGLCTTEELLEALQLRLGQLADSYKKIPIANYRAFHYQELVGAKTANEFKIATLNRYIDFIRNTHVDNIVGVRTITAPLEHVVERYWRGSVTYIVPEKE